MMGLQGTSFIFWFCFLCCRGCSKQILVLLEKWLLRLLIIVCGWLSWLQDKPENGLVQ